jgi:hypothetical protein
MNCREQNSESDIWALSANKQWLRYINTLLCGSLVLLFMTFPIGMTRNGIIFTIWTEYLPGSRTMSNCPRDIVIRSGNKLKGIKLKHALVTRLQDFKKILLSFLYITVPIVYEVYYNVVLWTQTIETAHVNVEVLSCTEKRHLDLQVSQVTYKTYMEAWQEETQQNNFHAHNISQTITGQWQYVSKCKNVYNPLDSKLLFINP